MYIIDDGIRLDAQIDMPESYDKAKKIPLVIIIHGFTGNKEERHILAVSHMFNELGCATLRVDMYGHGKSDGSFSNHNLFKWMGNAMTVIDYARSLDYVSDIYLCGHSQGGLTVMLAAALKHEFIKGLIPMSPAVMIPEGARKGMMLGIKFDPDDIPDVLPTESDWKLGGNYIRVAQTIHPEEAIARYHGPVLLVHGDADESVPVQCSIDAAKHYSNSELVLIHGDTHCYDNHLDVVVEAIRKWMVRQLS